MGRRTAGDPAMITYNQLRTFLAVARAGSLTKAARTLNASQPTVSLQLRALRRSLGAPLIERPDNGFRLTPAGERLRRYAEETLGGLRALQQTIADLKGTLAGPLAVGVTFVLSGHVLSPALARFRAQFPAVDMELHVDLPVPLFRHLLSGALDVACYISVPTPPEFTVETIGREELVVIASPQHPLAGRRRVSPEELSDQPFVVSTPPGFRQLLEGKLAGAGVKPREVVEARNHDAVKRLVERNAGYSLQIRSLVADELAAGQLVGLNLAGPPIESDIVAAVVSRRAVSPLVGGFVRFLRAELTEASTSLRRRRRSPPTRSAARYS
jgi:LysR family transcriptional regulator, low CO2-responsive transcriptional regulator